VSFSDTDTEDQPAHVDTALDLPAKKPGARRKGAATGAVRTYENLKALIISGEFSPGSDLDENELVQRFSVSRTPVREALIRLSMEGLVTIAPSRGAKVSNLNFSDITDHLEIMDILTPSVCYLAALRRTPEDMIAIKKQVDRLNSTRRDELQKRLDAIFHLYTALGKASHNETLSHLYRLTVYAKLRIGRVSAARSETKAKWAAHMAELQEVYNDLYNSIDSGDAHKAQLAARQWMNIIRKRLSSAVSSSPTQDIEIHPIA
jgi:DNA-binding GntR family transcriptional regulator